MQEFEQQRSQEAVETSAQQGIGNEVIKRLCAAWPKRATIRNDIAYLSELDDYVPEVPDYPAQLLPFSEHPDFVGATDGQKQIVATLAWLVYNERVIAAEEYVVNPTFAKIARGDFPGSNSFEIKEAVQQAYIDETWHTYMHMIAMKRTRELRNVTDQPAYPHTVTYRHLLAEQARCSSEWERNLLGLVWTTVSELSVSAYLELLSRDKDIQPLHSMVTRMHIRDESAHAPVMVEVAKDLYANMNETQRRSFSNAIPRALNAFAAQDYDVWAVVLAHAGVRAAEDIVEDSQRMSGNSLLVRDFSGVERLIREMDLGIDLAGVR